MSSTAEIRAHVVTNYIDAARHNRARKISFLRSYP
jgi:hypothetical protein